MPNLDCLCRGGKFSLSNLIVYGPLVTSYCKGISNLHRAQHFHNTRLGGNVPVREGLRISFIPLNLRTTVWRGSTSWRRNRATFYFTPASLGVVEYLHIPPNQRTPFSRDFPAGGDTERPISILRRLHGQGNFETEYMRKSTAATSWTNWLESKPPVYWKGSKTGDGYNGLTRGSWQRIK